MIGQYSTDYNEFLGEENAPVSMHLISGRVNLYVVMLLCYGLLCCGFRKLFVQYIRRHHYYNCSLLFILELVYFYQYITKICTVEFITQVTWYAEFLILLGIMGVQFREMHQYNVLILLRKISRCWRDEVQYRCVSTKCILLWSSEFRTVPRITRP